MNWHVSKPDYKRYVIPGNINSMRIYLTRKKLTDIGYLYHAGGAIPGEEKPNISPGVWIGFYRMKGIYKLENGAVEYVAQSWREAWKHYLKNKREANEQRRENERTYPISQKNNSLFMQPDG